MNVLSQKAIELLAPVSLLPIVSLDIRPAQLQTVVLNMAECLLSAGFSVVEIVLRTPIAIKAIELLATHMPELIVGAGTIKSAEELASASSAGARFVLSPGYCVSLIEAAQQHSMPILPGVATPSEVMRAWQAGFVLCKCFPVTQLGGLAYLKSLQGPFSEMIFCPTGGIERHQFADYLALSNVTCIGSSLIVPSDLLDTKAKPTLKDHLNMMRSFD